MARQKYLWLDLKRPSGATLSLQDSTGICTITLGNAVYLTFYNIWSIFSNFSIVTFLVMDKFINYSSLARTLMY